MKTFTLAATIPTTQYGNIQPSYTVEAETLEEAKALAFALIEADWDKYGDKPLKKKQTGNVVEVITFTGEKVLWNEAAHEYTDMQGNHLVSGSEYAQADEKPFDTALLSGKVASKYNVDPQDVADVWAGNSKISTTFGTALHLAMEQYFKYKHVACDDKEYNLAKPMFLRQAVESFPLKDEQILPEVVLSNIENKMAGTTDGLHIIGDISDKTCEVLDYKSDSDIGKNLKKHFRQLSYYAKILQLAGWSVRKVVVWNYTDKWEAHESDVLEVALN